MGDAQPRVVGREDDQPVLQQAQKSIAQSEAMEVLAKYEKESKVERWTKKETKTNQVFKEMMESGGPFKTQIKGKEMAKLRRNIDKKVLDGGVAIEEPFDEAVKKKFGIKYEIHRILKRQNELINTFNALSNMMPFIERLVDDDAGEEDIDEIYENIVKNWKIAFIEQSKAIYDIGNDLKKLEFKAAGVSGPIDKPEVSVISEEDREKLKMKYEQKKWETAEKLAERQSGVNQYSSNAPAYGYGRGRGSGLRSAYRQRGRGRGRGSRS